MKNLCLLFYFIGILNAQMETGNDLFTALNSVNEREKNHAKYFIAGFISGHRFALEGLNPYNMFQERIPNDSQYNIFLEKKVSDLELYPKNQTVAWDILFKIINDYLIEHPSERHHDAKILIRKSLLEAFRYNKN